MSSYLATICLTEPGFTSRKYGTLVADNHSGKETLREEILMASTTSTTRSKSKTGGSRSGGGSTSVVSKAVKAVAAMFTPSSETNAITLLKTDHDNVQKLFDKVKA